MSKKKAAIAEETKVQELPKISGFKGFDKNLKCRDMQYTVGEEAAMPAGKKLKCCPDSSSEGGLHFCEDPLDVFGYYPPAESRFAEVESRGETDKKGSDSKVATSRLFIKAEITLSHLIGAGVKFILDRVNWESNDKAGGNRSAATNTGNQSAATNTGDRSAATNTGDQSAATNTGYRSAATVQGKDSVAVCTGVEGKARGKKGCWIVLAEYSYSPNEGYRLKEVKTAMVDGEIIKEDIFYSLVNGNFVEAI